MGFFRRLALPALLLALMLGSCGDDTITNVDFTLRCAAGSCGGCNPQFELLPSSAGSITFQVRSAEGDDTIVEPVCLPLSQPFPLELMLEKLNMITLGPLPGEELLLFEVFVSTDTSGDCPSLPETVQASAVSTSLRLSENSGPVEMVVTCNPI